MSDSIATIPATNQICHAVVAFKLKTLILSAMLFAIYAIFPASVVAAEINNVNRAAAMEKQRNLNKKNLAKLRHFDRRVRHAGALKLDALPQSPRRGAHTATANPILAASPKAGIRRTNSVAQASAY